MAATRSRSKHARSTPARHRPAARKAPARRPQRREPWLQPGQGRELTGLALIVLGVFCAIALYSRGGGAAVGVRLRQGLEQVAGRGAVGAPPLLMTAGLALLVRVDPRGLRPFRIGAVAATLGALMLLGGDRLDAVAVRRGGGLIGNGLHHAFASVAGSAGAALVAMFLLAGGALLVSGASAAASLRWSARAAQRSARQVARATAVALPPRPRPATKTSRRSTTIDDAETRFPDVFSEASTAVLEPEPMPEPEPAFEPASLLESLREPDPFEPPVPTLLPDDVDEPPAPPRDGPPYRLPDPSVLRRGGPTTDGDQDAARVSRALLGALNEHGVDARLVGTVSGPRVTRYELQLAPGTKVSRVSSLRDDLAYALATTEIRILAPIPGKQAVGVEVPNRSPNLVALGDLVGDLPGATPLTVWLGKDISGHTVTADLTRMPHLLIAGTTGSGKSGCINAMLCSVLLRASPDEVRMILVDPKKVELNHYETIPHLLTPVVTNMKNAAAVLGNIVREMESRYEIMGQLRARNLIELNRARARDGRAPLPYILVVIDELADLMMVSPAEVEDAVIRLAQKSRAVGIHLVLATQRPSVDVITGMIKANVPSRIAFAVSSQTDSRVILDTAGAESLLGQGDMLYKPLGTSRLQRVQGAYISEEEIALLVEQCRRQAEPEFADDILEQLPDVEPEELDPDEDPLLEDAILCVAQHETASVSLLQRRLRVGYTRAGRLIDMLERRGVISGYEGSKPRRVLVSYDEAARIAGRDRA